MFILVPGVEISIVGVEAWWVLKAWMWDSRTLGVLLLCLTPTKTTYVILFQIFYSKISMRDAKLG